MKHKLLLLGASMLVSSSVFAQWTKPEAPKSTPLATETELYLYNKDAGAFFSGYGASYGTRASVSYRTGEMVKLREATTANYAELDDPDLFGEWDGVTYVFQDSIISKTRWDEVWFGEDSTTIWTDRQNNVASNVNFVWNFENQGGDIYRIKASEKAANYFADNQKGVYGWMGVVKEFGNNQCYFCSDVNFPGLTQQIDWYFVTPEEYEAVIPGIALYDAATHLGDTLTSSKALYASIDLADAEAIYSNYESTVAELDSAVGLVTDAVLAWKAAELEKNATPENPSDMADLIGNTTFESGISGWSTTTGAQNNTTATNKTGEQPADDNQNFIGQFWENWNPSAYSGKMYKVLEDMPNGVYSVQMGAFSNVNPGAYVYLNGDSTAVKSSIPKTYKVWSSVSTNTVEIGLKAPEKGPNWMGIDNVVLMYYGASVESYQFLVANTALPAEYFEDPDIHVYAEQLEAYNALVEQATSLTTVEELLAAIPEIQKATVAIYDNIAAYDAFIAKVAEGNELLEDPTITSEELTDYLMDAEYEILEENTLSTEELYAEIEKLNALMEAAKLSAIYKGKDVTNLIVNPNFSDNKNGWLHDETKAGPAHGGLTSNPCMEVWNNNFDSYQDLVGLPNGVYEVKVQAFYRTGSSTTAAYNEYVGGTASEILAFVYANEFSAPVCDIASVTYTENLENNCEAVDATNGIYVPNGMNSASNAFTRGDYECKVYGLVTDGKLRIGIRHDGTVGGRWTLWDNFRLVYQEFDETVLSDMITTKIEEANTLLEAEAMNATVLEALNTAIAAAQDAVDGEAKFTAVAALNTAINNAKASIDAYEKLGSALDVLSEALEAYGGTASEEAVTEASALLDALSAGYSDGTYADDAIDAEVEKVEKIVAKLKIPATEDVTDDNPMDMTHLLVNPGFDEGNRDGWTLDIKAGGNNQPLGDAWEFWYGSASDAEFNLRQPVYALPEGKYQFGGELAQSYNGQASLGNEGRVFIYATVVVDGDSTTYSAMLEPTNDNADVARAPIAVTFDVPASESEVIVLAGIKTVGTQDARWFACDNFTLTYFGKESQKESNTDESAIESIEATTVLSSTFYNLGGAQLAEPQKGVNIVKSVLSNGKVVVSKIFVK